MNFVSPSRRADIAQAPDLLAALLLTLREESDALKDGNVARLAAAESRRRHLLRLLEDRAYRAGD